MDTVKEIEWCASWECPSCKNDTDQTMNHEAIDEHDGPVIKVTCPHNIDNGDDSTPVCGHVYLVDLRG